MSTEAHHEDGRPSHIALALLEVMFRAVAAGLAFSVGAFGGSPLVGVVLPVLAMPVLAAALLRRSPTLAAVYDSTEVRPDLGVRLFSFCAAMLVVWCVGVVVRGGISF